MILSNERYYLTAEYPCSYLEGNIARSEVAPPQLAYRAFGELIRSGFRRSGFFVYRPACRHCMACIAVRVDAAAFEPNRSQKRCWQRNERLEVIACEPSFDKAHFDLYRRYQHARHPGGTMDSMEQYCEALLQSQVDSTLYEFREADKLVMVSIVDRIEDGLSSVYAFFDPDAHRAGLGTYNILWQIDMSRKMGLPYVYLGYWVENSRKMSYKINFAPIEGHIEGKWSPLA